MMKIDQKAVVQTIGTITGIIILFLVFFLYPYATAMVLFSLVGLLFFAYSVKIIYLIYASRNQSNSRK